MSSARMEGFSLKFFVTDRSMDSISGPPSEIFVAFRRELIPAGFIPQPAHHILLH